MTSRVASLRVRLGSLGLGIAVIKENLEVTEIWSVAEEICSATEIWSAEEICSAVKIWSAAGRTVGGVDHDVRCSTAASIARCSAAEENGEGWLGFSQILDAVEDAKMGFFEHANLCAIHGELATIKTATLQPSPGLAPLPRTNSTSPAGTPRAAENGSRRKKKSNASKNKSTAQQIPPKPSSSHQAQEATAMFDWMTINSSPTLRACSGDTGLTPPVDVSIRNREMKSMLLKITSEYPPPLTVNKSGPLNTEETSVPSPEPQCLQNPEDVVNLLQNLEDVVSLFSKMKPIKDLGDMDILDVCAMKGIHFPQPSWWRPGGYDD